MITVHSLQPFILFTLMVAFMFPVMRNMLPEQYKELALPVVFLFCMIMFGPMMFLWILLS